MKYLATFIVAVAALMGASGVHALPMLSIDVDPGAAGIQSARTVSVGSLFTIDVRIDGVTGLFAYDIDVSHDSAVLTATGAPEGPFLASGGATFFDATPGTPVNAVGVLLGFVPGVSGSAVLYSIQYTTLAVGVSSLDFTFMDLLDDEFETIVPTLAGGRISVVEQVPLPSTLLALAAGFAALAPVGRRRRGSGGAPNPQLPALDGLHHQLRARGALDRSIRCARGACKARTALSLTSRRGHPCARLGKGRSMIPCRARRVAQVPLARRQPNTRRAFACQLLASSKATTGKQLSDTPRRLRSSAVPRKRCGSSTWRVRLTPSA